MAAYDDVWSVDFYGEHQRPLWRRFGEGALELIRNATRDYDRYIFPALVCDHQLIVCATLCSLFNECAEFDANLMARLVKAGGAQYAAMASLGYRQAMSNMKFTWSAKYEEPWCVNTNESNRFNLMGKLAGRFSRKRAVRVALALST